jgi:hypothetical protein
MAYRDDRQALSLQVADLERENEELRQQVAQLKEQAKRKRVQQHEDRRNKALRSCALCGGSLLPVALFAGRDLKHPIPLLLSTARFGDPGGGFNRSAPLKSKVCSSCGFIQSFIDIEAPDAAEVTGSFETMTPDPMEETIDEDEPGENP